MWCFFVQQVTYQTDLFLEKNKDYVVAEHQALLGSSACPFVASLFPKSGDEGSKSSYKFSSIGTRFKVCLVDLSHSPMFGTIRCNFPLAMRMKVGV